MIMMLLLIAVGAGAFWAGKNSHSYPPAEIARPPAEQQLTRSQVMQSPAPVWPWLARAAVLGLLLLGVAAGPGGPFGGPGLFAGLMGP